MQTICTSFGRMPSVVLPSAVQRDQGPLFTRTSPGARVGLHAFLAQVPEPPFFLQGGELLGFSPRSKRAPVSVFHSLFVHSQASWALHCHCWTTALTTAECLVLTPRGRFGPKFGVAFRSGEFVAVPGQPFTFVARKLDPRTFLQEPRVWPCFSACWVLACLHSLFCIPGGCACSSCIPHGICRCTCGVAACSPQPRPPVCSRSGACPCFFRVGWWKATEGLSRIFRRSSCGLSTVPEW